MRTATGESDSDVEEAQIAELEQRLTRFRIQVPDDMTIRGNAWQGFAHNAYTCDELGLGGTPVIGTGACCLPDGTCEEVTPGQCLFDGGTFVGGLCVDTDCTGACCDEDGSCTETTLDGCSGTFQGYGTDCDPNPCPTPPPPTGACCVGTDCSITTEDDCTGMGGTYQGDDTTCDPNPCEGVIPSPCCDGFGFSGFIDPTTKFLKHTKHYTYSDSDGPPGLNCMSSWDYTTIYTINPTTCEITIECFGSGSISGDLFPDGGVTWTWIPNVFTDCNCSPTTPSGFVCAPCNFNSCSGLSGASTVISNTEKQDTCSDSTSGFSASATYTETLSEPCIQT